MRKFLPLLVLVACGGGAASKHDAVATATLPPLPPPERAAYDKPVAAAPPLTTPTSDLRLTAVDQGAYESAKAMVAEGRLRAARRQLAKLVVAYPDRPSLVADYNALQEQIQAAETTARASLDGHAVVTPPAPPAVYTLAHPAHVDAAPIPKLKLKSASTNQITDEERWFKSNQISLPEYYLPPGGDVFYVSVTITAGDAVAKLGGYAFADWQKPAHYLAADFPSWVPVSYGTIPITRAIDSAPYTIAIYGARFVAVFDETKQVRGLFDFDLFTHPPSNQKGQLKVGEMSLTTRSGTVSGDLTTETNTVSHELEWALAKGGTLFVEHTNHGYAKDSRGQNAYVTAIDLDGGQIAWRSQPLVANAGDFALVGGAVIAGYGFTAEPDFLFVLDAATGAVKQKLPVPSGPDSIYAGQDRVLVRTYDHDLVFDVH